jgi:cytochrome c oxidase subunit 2
MNNPIISDVDNTFILIVIISVFFLLLITFLMIYFVFKYRKKKHPVAENITGNTALEVLWTVIPLALVMLIFFFGWAGFNTMRTVPPDAMVIKVTASMWKWSFEYANKKQSDSLLFVPVNKPIKMEIHSVDVNHSFYIPAFREKEDAIPGRTNYLWFLPNEVGEYQIECAEYCGLNHSYMLGKLIVMPVEQFNEWYNAPIPRDTIKVDTMKTVAPAQDTLKVNSTGNIKDTTKTKKKD